MNESMTSMGSSASAPPTSLADRVRVLLAQVVRDAGFDLVELKLSGGSERIRLQLFVDRFAGQGSVDISACASLSRKVEALLDVTGWWPERYGLEVSSPGMNRLLRGREDFERFAGMTAKVSVLNAEGQRESHVGRIDAVDEDGVALVTAVRKDGAEARAAVAWDDILRATLKPTMDEWAALGAQLAREDAARQGAAGDAQGDRGDATGQNGEDES